MIPSAERLGALARLWAGPLLLLILATVVAGCFAPDPAASPNGTGVPGTPTPEATPQHPLRPASPSGPDSLIGWIFTPIFQVMFIFLVAVYHVLHEAGVPGAVGIAIIVLTLAVRTLLIPLFRRQLVSQRRMQLLQPEMSEIRKRYKGDAMKIRVAQQELMKERGVNPVSGCLPILLQLPLLFVIYQVISNGLTSYDPRPMLTVAGIQLVPLECSDTPPPPGTLDPCIDTIVPWLFNLDISRPETTLIIFGFGLSLLAVGSAAVQLVQSRMMLQAPDPANDDPNLRIQRQMMLFLPLISVLYGGILPAGLFIYWIVATVFSIGQQYLIVGWGGMFPFFGWTPRFAVDHSPRFPVAMPVPRDPSTTGPASKSPPVEPTKRAKSADKTIRPRERGRHGRRGRRR
ncbi:MAG TPA: membrane protein insertase YidC [Vitreimonas sp.]|nr:membrane protein insertase YidC [Vitreimonas sp.]